MDRQHARDRVIGELARRQHGVVARSQLLAAGISRDLIDIRLRSGRLLSLHRGVYALGHDRLRPEGRWMAAVLAVGRGAVLSHHHAAANWGLRPPEGSRIHVTLPGRAGRVRRAGVRIHRPELFDPADAGVHGGIPTTTVERTLLDLAVVLPGRELEQLVRSASRRRRFDLRKLVAVVDRHPTHRGVRETTAMIVRMHGRGTEDLRSRMETRFLQLCDDHGIPRPMVNGHVEGERVDFAWPAARLVIETDGFEWHMTPAQFAADRARDQLLTLAGHRVVRFTWDQVRYEPGQVAAAVSALLSHARAPQVAGAPEAPRASRRS
ncbi:MAG TPA: DUF559 domain-containing protein [Baekduia sp.]|nr:DUF559 domain-containing protein [Baekduia sp.]